MAEKRTVEEIIAILTSGVFDSLIGAIEDDQLEVKGSPYQFSSDWYRQELAKDVSALANANGGIILIGFSTKKDANTAVECVDQCRPFDLALVNTEQYRNTLEGWIYPPIRSVQIGCFLSSSLAGKGVAAIVVPATATEGKPYIVTRTVEVDGVIRGTQFGLYERVQDGIPANSAGTLRGYLRDGMRFAEIMQRLSTIEAFLGNLAVPNAPAQIASDTIQKNLIIQGTGEESKRNAVVLAMGVTDAEIQGRIDQAERAVERTSKPNIVLTVASTNQCTFPELFHSQSAAIVRLLEEPPVLRQDGFAITLKSSYKHAEIIEGQLRRVVARGHKLIDLWKDGVLIAVGPGDDDLLCWYTRNHVNPKPGLPIRNFVLAEVTLNFLNLAFEIFKNAKPSPQELKFFLVLENMTEEGVTCTLSSARDNRPFSVETGNTRSAPAAVISSSFTVEFESMDVGIVAYQLLGGLYARFGFNYDEMPYVQDDSDAKRITPKSIAGEPWK